MKRLLIAILLIAAVAGAAFASAAVLPVQGGTVQYGADYTLACDPDGVKVTAWASNTENNGDQYQGLDWVTISDVAPACAGNELAVRLRLGDGSMAWGGPYNGSAQAAQASGSGIINLTSATEYKVALHKDSSGKVRWFVPPQLVEGIEVWVGGAGNQ